MFSGSRIHLFIAVLLLAFLPMMAMASTGADATAAAEGATAVATTAAQRPAALYYAIAASIAFGCMSAGYAVGKIGAAVMGAAAEKPEVMGKAIAFVAMGEGIALFGFLIALFMYSKI